MYLKSCNPIIIFLLVFALLQLNSCKKDPCETVICLNGGVCNDGLCDCPDGYSGTQCETYDDCFGIVCLNNGVCVNGICNCPEGYTGSDCSQQVTPNKIKINKIVVKDFPPTDNGAGWDLISGPDIYPEIYDPQNNLLYSSSTYFPDADPQIDYDFDCSPSVDLTDPNAQYIFQLMDYDTGSDDWMGSIGFTPYYSTNGFPSVLTYSVNTNGLSFDLHVTYTW
tara:strand:- start:170 stop:838 length:669 start_codon:yes stop_codon:yes gene_type:complete